MAKRLEIDDTMVVRLYESGLRAAEIGRQLDCSAEVVYSRLAAAGVVRSRFLRLPYDEIVQLYTVDRWAASRIAAKYGVAARTIRDGLRRHGVQIRSQVESLQPLGRATCPRSASYRAYALGLVWGDYFVESHGAEGKTITVRTNTTRSAQVDLTFEVFASYGPVRTSGYTIRRLSIIRLHFSSRSTGTKYLPGSKMTRRAPPS